MTGQLGTPREGLMNIAASFPSVMKPRFNRPVGKSQTQEGDAASFATAPDNKAPRPSFALRAAT
jgi:hypothetical protein